MMAIAAGAEFQRRGYKIPEDIIITGFDGSEEANFCTPMLTTSGCSYDDTAKTIINVISKALAGEKPEKYIQLTMICPLKIPAAVNPQWSR